MADAESTRSKSQGLGPIAIHDESNVCQFDICDSNHFRSANQFKTKSEDSDGHEAPGSDDCKQFEVRT